MKNIIFSIMVIFFFASSLVKAAANDSVIAITNAVIIDGHGGSPITNASIVIRNNRIENIGTEILIPENATVINANGKTVMPGLADMHVHLAATASNNGTDVLGYQKRLNALIYAGVTTVFDLGNFLPFVAQMKQEINAGRIIGPNIYYVGPLIESADPNWPLLSRSMTSNSQAENIVDHLIENGASALKAYGRLSGPQIRALTWQANKKNLPVFVDVWIRNGAPHLLTAGIKAFAHVPNTVSEDTIKTMKDRNIFIITTNAGRSGEVRLVDPSYLNHPLIADTTDQNVLDRTFTDAQDIKSTDEYKFKVEFIPTMLGNTKKLFDGGVTLVAGTDGAANSIFLGESLHEELKMMVDAGLTPLEAITTATKNAALLVNELEGWGTLDIGKRADVLIVNGRPDLNISDTRNIETVIKNGQIINREALTIENNKAPVFMDFDP